MGDKYSATEDECVLQIICIAFLPTDELLDVLMLDYTVDLTLHVIKSFSFKKMCNNYKEQSCQRADRGQQEQHRHIHCSPPNNDQRERNWLRVRCIFYRLDMTQAENSWYFSRKTIFHNVKRHGQQTNTTLFSPQDRKQALQCKESIKISAQSNNKWNCSLGFMEKLI